MSDDGREAQIRLLFPLVRRIARRVARMVAGADVDDLVGDGCVGLIRAVDTFDPSRGLALETYARRIVVGAMLNGLRRSDPVSERARRELREAERERFALANERGALPSIAEMEQRRTRLRGARAAAYRYAPLSLDGPLPPTEALPADDRDDPLRIVLKRSASRELSGALALLPPRQRLVLALHYFRELPLRRIGDQLRVSPQRASQLHLAALQRLRRTLAP
jgi:RNA polymerase sigma factor for flagellar operon FliA